MKPSSSLILFLVITFIFVIEGCEDIASKKQCQKWLSKGKCSKNWAVKKCPKTCGECTNDDDICKDTAKAKKCKKWKNKGKCSKNWVAKKCAKTCDLCDGTGSGADPSLKPIYDQTGAPWHIHDPSKIVPTDGILMIADTGKAQEDGYNCGLETWHIAPGQTDWQPGQCLFTSKPSWVAEELPGNDGAYWAPTLVNSRMMYYSVASMNDDDAQCIGMARATGTAPNLSWTDSGDPITCSFNPESNGDINMPNAIDPAVFIDDNGSMYLIYGGGRIWMTQLDPETGKQIEENWWEENDPTYHYLARGPESFDDPGEFEWIEAPYVHKNNGFYYLFVNWFGCCNGVDSTYEIHIGRSNSITGPYVDQNGVDMRLGGGSLLLKKEGRYVGPGHAGVFSEGGHDWLSYHFYNAENDGLPWVDIRKLEWENDWPKASEERFDPNVYFGQ